VPYNLTVVKLDEGPVMESVLIGVKHGDIKVGQRVEAVFEDVGGTYVPKFKLAAKR